jgi:regulator of PEP synthase PpsR (kinase-PPPase family)
MEAINFSMAHDDGASHADLAQRGRHPGRRVAQRQDADVPYLALQFGVKAANCPLIPRTSPRGKLPEALRAHKAKIFGLTIGAERLHEIRQQRRPDSQYAALANCREEVQSAEAMMRREGIRWLDSTANRSRRSPPRSCASSASSGTSY